MTQMLQCWRKYSLTEPLQRI